MPETVTLSVEGYPADDQEQKVPDVSEIPFMLLAVVEPVVGTFTVDVTPSSGTLDNTRITILRTPKIT